MAKKTKQATDPKIVSIESPPGYSRKWPHPFNDVESIALWRSKRECAFKGVTWETRTQIAVPVDETMPAQDWAFLMKIPGGCYSIGLDTNDNPVFQLNGEPLPIGIEKRFRSDYPITYLFVDCDNTGHILSKERKTLVAPNPKFYLFVRDIEGFSRQGEKVDWNHTFHYQTMIFLIGHFNRYRKCGADPNCFWKWLRRRAPYLIANKQDGSDSTGKNRVPRHFWENNEAVLKEAHERLEPQSRGLEHLYEMIADDLRPKFPNVRISKDAVKGAVNKYL